MSFMNWIIEDLNSASDFFYSIYLEVLDWVWPFWLAADFFYSLCRVFNWLAWDFSRFAEWVNDVADQVENILSWSTIWSYILSYVPNLVTIRDWFYSWWNNVTSVVTSWWSSTQWTVQGWITTATQGLSTLTVAWDNFWTVTWPDWMNRFAILKAAWDDFWTVTFPNLVSFNWLGIWWNDRLQDIDRLMSDKLTTWFPFYDDLSQLWREIADFFTNPLEFLWAKFTDWFLGPE